MTMTITHLGTGSRGNSTLLETPHAKVLIDQGFSGTQLAKRLARPPIKRQKTSTASSSRIIMAITAVAPKLCKPSGSIPVLANERTALELDLVPELTTFFEALDLVRVGDDLSILPVPVPHAGSDNVRLRGQPRR